jgi:Protein of unknown function (DUF2917)
MNVKGSVVTTQACPNVLVGKNAVNVNLQRQAIISVPDSANIRIACVEGSVWITLDNDPRDVILDPCQVFSSLEHRRAIIYAFKPSVINLMALASDKTSDHPTLPSLVLQLKPA